MDLRIRGGQVDAGEVAMKLGADLDSKPELKEVATRLQ